MIVDNEKLVLQSLIDLFEMHDYAVEAFLSTEGALASLLHPEKVYDVIITDINMPVIDGYQFIKQIRNSPRAAIKVLVLTGYGTIEGAVKAVQLGADAYCQKDQDPELLLFEVSKLLDQMKLQASLEHLRQQGYDHQMYLFSSNNEKTRKAFETAKKIANKDVNILITGESGTGKEIFSRYIFKHSDMKGRFISVNCSAIPDTLFESAMFGHKKGSFTGAHSDTQGFFRMAEGGVLLLDEIGELLPMNQAKLLKVIEERYYYPVGSSEKMYTNCRIIAATNQDLQQKLADGSFRMDFYYRLNTVTFNLTPLRERSCDIMDLVRVFINHFSQKYQTTIDGVSDEARRVIEAFSWPGNIRQLRQVIERCVLFSSGSIISGDLVCEHLQEQGTNPSSDKLTETGPYRDAKRAFEKTYFSQLLELTSHNIGEVSSLSGLNRTYIYKKIKELSLSIRA